MPSVRLLSLALLLPLAVLARAPMAPPPALPPETSPAPTRTIAALPAIAADAPVYSIDGTGGPPTDEETLYLEYINRARMDPTGEGTRLRNTTDPDVTSTYTYFNVDLAKMESEFQALSPVPPLAFNAQLLNDARGHTQDMFDHTYQGHTGSDGSTIGTRATAVGYNYSLIAENVFSYAESVFHGHAGFEVDWGNEADGMQAGRGHRANIHNATAREIGVGVVLGTKSGNDLANSPTTVGPQLVTQEFGNRSGVGPLLTGVAYFDFSRDNFYSIGEGLGNVTVTVAGATYSAVTTPSGAFTIPLPASGTYAVTFSGLGFSQTANVTSNGGQNVKLDFTPTYTRPVVSGPATLSAGASTPYSFTAAPGATGYTLVSYQRSTSGVSEKAESLAGVTLDVSSDYSVLSTSTKSQGSAAFNLRHPASINQYLTLNRVLYPRSGASLSFASRLTIATSSEVAKVQISTDAGASWTDLYTQSGPGQPGETSFTTRIVSLAAYADQVCRVRFVYLSTAAYYPADNSGTIGWYIDDIAFTNTDELTNPTSTTLGASATSFNFTAPATGSYLLSLVPQNVTRDLPAATAVLVTATGTALPPTITSSPAGQTTVVGADVTFSVAADGTAPLAYQWFKDGAVISGATQSTLTLHDVTTSDAGNYTVTVSNSAGTMTSSAAALTVNTALPAITAQPAGTTVTAGSPVTLSVTVSSTTPATYQWSKDGSPLSGQTASSLTLASTTTADSGNYTVTITNSGGSVTSDIAAVLVRAANNDAPGSYLANLSVRASMSAQQTLILGFVVNDGSKPVLVRAAGPGLATQGVTGVLADPKLTLYNSGGTALANNDNWDSSLAPTFARLGAFAFVEGSKDAALLQTLTSANTAHAPAGATGGIQLVELYDAGDNDGAKLVNVSARNHVGTGADILIAGFVISGSGNMQVLVRAVGPGLAKAGVTGVLANPQLGVYDQGNLIASNDDWSSGLINTYQTVGASPLDPGSKDAALVLTLSPGVYTVQVSGVGATTGEALVEVYAIP